MDIILISNINIYRSTSKRNYNKYKEILRLEKELLAQPNLYLLGNDLNEMLSEYYNQERSHQMAFIVFQAMAVEAFLNEYITLRLGKSYFESMDKLSPTDKLLIACKLITGKDFPKDVHAYALLRNTLKYRNELVHFKSKEIDIQEFINNNKEISEKEIDDISMTYDKIVEQLNLLDNNFDNKYLEPVPDDFWNIKY